MPIPHDLSPSERRVLDVIWRHGPIARVDISPLTELSTMSVTRITRELTDRGLLVEEVLRTGLRGQPSRPLMVRPDAAYSAGVYFTTKDVQVGMIDLSGALLERETLDLGTGTPAEVAAAAETAIAGFCHRRGLARSLLAGVGFALPGDFIDDRKQLNPHPRFPLFHGADLQAELQAHLGNEVFVENDAASAALGERLLGVGQSIDNYYFAHIGHGIGGGLILDGRLHRGVHGNAGLIGVQFPNDEPRPSGQDLFDHLRRSGIAVEDFTDLQDLLPQTCPPLKAWLNRAASQLQRGLSVTARILDPEAVVIGGRMPHHLLQELAARIDGPGFCDEGVGLPRPRVLASALGPLAGVIGAAAQPIYVRFLEKA